MSEATIRFLTPAELRASVPHEPDWIWDGYLATGTLTLLAGKPKIGKSTLAMAVSTAVATGAESFLERAVSTSPVVYLTEESTGTLLHKLPQEDADLHLLTRDNAWPKPEWPKLVAGAVAHARQVAARLLIVDTAAYWTALPAEREKDAGAVQATMLPLIAATRQGIAVALVHHTRKAGGEDGDALRGSSGWAASADTILELERPDDEHQGPHRRVLLALGRYPQTPAVVIVDHDPASGSWASAGQATSRRDARGASARGAVLAALPDGPPGVTRQEIEAGTGLPSQRLHKPMKDLLETAQIAREGAGRKGDPYRWHKLPTEAAQPPWAENGQQASGTAVLSAALPVGEQQNPATPDETPPRAARAETNGYAQATPEQEAAYARALSLLGEEAR